MEKTSGPKLASMEEGQAMEQAGREMVKAAIAIVDSQPFYEGADPDARLGAIAHIAAQMVTAGILEQAQAIGRPTLAPKALMCGFGRALGAVMIQAHPDQWGPAAEYLQQQIAIGGHDHDVAMMQAERGQS